MSKNGAKYLQVVNWKRIQLPRKSRQLLLTGKTTWRSSTASMPSLLSFATVLEPIASEECVS